MAEADKVVVEIEARVDQANRALTQHANTADKAMTAVERSAAKAEAAIRTTAVVVVDNTGRIANAQRNLGRQIADVGSSLASGSSPFMVLAQQAPQVADALTDMGGKAGKVAAFFSGPWGAALLAAGSVVGVLASSLLSSDDAAKQHEKSAKSLADAIRDMTAATKGAIQTSQQAEEQHYREASALAAKAEQARVTTIRMIQAAKARLETADRQSALPGDPEGGIAAGVTAGATQERQLTKLNALLKEQNAQLQTQYANVRRAAIPRLQREAAEATDQVAAATGRYDRALGKLNERMEAGRITPAQYLSELEKLNRTRDSETEAARKSERATKGDSDAKREAAKAAKEAAQAQKELEQALERVVAKFDPLRAIAAETGKTLADIDKLQMAGLITAVDAVAYKLKLANDQAKAIADAAWKAQEQRWLGVGITQEDMDGSGVRKDIDRRVEMEREANERIAADFRQKQEAQIRTLANIFEDGFRGGTKAIWGDFKAIGMRILAEMIARWLVMKSSGQSGGSIGSLFSSAAKSVLGFSTKSAGGGETGTGVGFAIGGYTGGGDRNQVAGAVHKGEYVFDAGATNRIGVGNLAAMRNGALPRSMAGAGGFAIQQTVHVDARNSVNPTGFERRLLSLSGQQAVEAASAMGRAVYKGVPSRLAEYGRDGT